MADRNTLSRLIRLTKPLLSLSGATAKAASPRPVGVAEKTPYPLKAVLPSVVSQPVAPQRQTGVERRTSVRYPCNLETACAPVAAESGASWGALIRDVSLGGVSLLLNRRFEPGTLLRVELRDADETERTLFVRVVYVGKKGSGWQHGCAFTRNLSEDELGSFTPDRGA
jgi:hypothetical protein